MTEHGFILPMASEAASGAGRIWRSGVLVNALVSSVAALVSRGLYGIAAAMQVFAPMDAGTPNLTYSALVGAVVIGIGGARWLTSVLESKGKGFVAAKAHAPHNPQFGIEGGHAGLAFAAAYVT